MHVWVSDKLINMKCRIFCDYSKKSNNIFFWLEKNTICHNFEIKIKLYHPFQVCLG